MKNVLIQSPKTDRNFKFQLNMFFPYLYNNNKILNQNTSPKKMKLHPTQSSFSVLSEPPTIELDFRDKIIIRVGESCLLQGRYTGKPSPSIIWYREDKELKADQHVMFKNTLTTMSLGLMKARREHSGRYMVVVENSTGSRKGVCNITVVGMYGKKLVKTNL